MTSTLDESAANINERMQRITNALWGSGDGPSPLSAESVAIFDGVQLLVRTMSAMHVAQKRHTASALNVTRLSCGGRSAPSVWSGTARFMSVLHEVTVDGTPVSFTAKHSPDQRGR